MEKAKDGLPQTVSALVRANDVSGNNGRKRVDITRRLIGISAIHSADNKEVVDVDVSGLIRRLLLFDKYVLASSRLREFPLLVRYFGFEGLRELLAAKLIEIRCECFQPAQTAQTPFADQPTFPLFTYRFDWIDAHDRRKYVHDCLQNVHNSPGLHRKQVSKLKLAIVNSIRPLPADERTEWFPSFQNDLLHNENLVRTSIALVIRSRLHLEDVPFSFALVQEGADRFRVTTDLHHRLNISEYEAHEIIQRGLLGIAGLVQTVGQMKAYSAISGFRDNELPLFLHKLGFLAETASSQNKEDDFRRVINIAELPDFPAGDERINVDKLLKVRDSAEAREFRDWLGGIGNAEDAEIKERIRGLKATVGLKVGSAVGKAMRFLVTTGLGLIPHAIVPAIAVGALDQFILDKVFPRSGVAAFINELYPSIFNSEK
jgi:hypothetical protein